MATTEETKVAPVDDESALDKELEESLASVKAGNAISPETAKPQEPVVPVTPEKPKAEEVPAPTQQNAQPTEPKKDDEFRIPEKGKNESDESYEARVKLFDLVRRRKAATTPEAKERLSKEEKEAKNELASLGLKDKFKNINTEPKVEPVKKPDQAQPPISIDDAIEADKARLRELGGVTKEDIESMLSQREQAIEVQHTIGSFFEKHKVFADQDMKDAFLDFVNENYAWQNKSGKALTTILELARESVFKPSETVQERVINGANVQEKVNAMNFPGGSAPVPALPKDKQDSVDELVKTGMSREKALELVS